MRGPIITLTTDFGTVDGYAGAAKGVILSICPEARLVDITHQIPPQNMVAAAEALRAAVPWYPPDAIHLAVIDPGVGGLRRPLALRSPDWTLVGPDNGVFSPLWRAALERHGPEAVHAVHLTGARFFLPRVSATFHGRDLFAPVAAHLALGRSLVLQPQSQVDLHVTSENGAILSVDGQEDLPVSTGVRVEVRQSEHITRFVRFREPSSFYSELAEKLEFQLSSIMGQRA